METSIFSLIYSEIYHTLMIPGNYVASINCVLKGIQTEVHLL